VGRRGDGRRAARLVRPAAPRVRATGVRVGGRRAADDTVRQGPQGRAARVGDRPRQGRSGRMSPTPSRAPRRAGAHKPKKTAMLLAQRIVAEIVDGGLEPGASLLSEREMLEEYEVA